MHIGQRIAARRKQLDMTQEELAYKMGYKTKSSINKIELGINDVPQKKIVLFAEVLDTTINYLMGWEEPEEKKQTAQDERHALVNELFDRLSPEDQQYAVDLLKRLSQSR